MMKLSLIAIGSRMPGWVNEGVAEYQKRLSGAIDFRIVEVPAIKRTKGSDLARVARSEGEKLLGAVPGNAMPIALDAAGRQFSSEAFSRQVSQWIDDNQDIALLVGGPEGLSSECLNACRMKLSLSQLTFAHPLVRLVLAEQLYRAWSIRQGLPYHR